LVLKLPGSRLHFLLSRDLLVASFRGRKSGRQFSTPLSYAEEGGHLYLCTRPEVASWWKNMRGGAPIEITWLGRSTPARATVLDSSSEEARAGFRAFLIKNPGTASLLYNVEVGKAGDPDEEDVLREVRQSVIVRIEPESEREIARATD
jgi:hypothetical protein